MAADDTMVATIFDRLAESDQPGEVVDLVLAALDGPSALDALAEGRSPERPAPSDERGTPLPVDGVYLAGISASAFRGIGPAAELPLDAQNGLTVVVGPNGSGKSSFAEALEVALTGTTHRFTRSSVWRKGWRNLHHDGPSNVTLAMHVPGHAGVTSLVCELPGEAVADAKVSVRPATGAAFPPEQLGWGPALSAMSPICANGEIEALIESTPSELHDRLAAVLGLESVEEAVALLKARHGELRALLKERDDAKRTALEALATVDDERASGLTALLRKRPPPLDEVANIVRGASGADPAFAALEAIAALEPIDLDRVSDRTASLRDAQAAVIELDTPENREASLTMRLLQQALELHLHHDDHGTCPVCGTRGALDEAWRSRTTELCGQLEERSNALQAALARRKQVLADLTDLSRPPTLVDSMVGHVDVAALADAWRRWHDEVAQGADAAADCSAEDFEHQALTVEELRQHVVAAAKAELDARHASWRQATEPIAAYLGLARAAEPVEPRQRAMKTAAEWLEETLRALRNERVDAVRVRARELWAKLRQQSSVELRDFQFNGTGKQRHVTFDVLIDGSPSQALGVMSQGELNALALSVFLPRATQAESPFRFVVVDDPVQAMDPAKVDGLAQVLDELAQSRQVVVFTHDLRLVDAIEHQGIAATVLSVERGPHSTVSVTIASDPVSRLLDEAAALPVDPNVPVDVAQLVCGNLCRQALESALARRFRRARFAAGEHPDHTEAALRATKGLYELTALALLGDPTAGSRVLNHLNNKWTRRGGDAFLALNQAGHIGLANSGQVAELVRDARFLIGKVEAA